MPTKLSIFGEIPVQQIKSKSIDSIPEYLRRYKEDASKEIAKWDLNSQTSNVNSTLLAIGNGSPINTGSSVSYNSFSSLVLGKYNYENRWQLGYLSDDNLVASYFDGNTYFKRFSIDYKTGVIKARNSDLRNGNVINCNSQYQLSFGYSKDASFEDYSLYRHNFRTTHSNVLASNSENAVDLYLWDRNNDLPESIGSRHVVRWNALGNEELVSGFRIDGGVNYDLSIDTTGVDEQNKFAIAGKGVIYYNNKSNQYRYSENGNKFKPFGSGSGSSGYYKDETTYMNRCFLKELPLPTYDPGDPTVFNATGYGVALYAHRRSRIKSITVGSGASGGIICISIYKNSSDIANVPQTYYQPVGFCQAYAKINTTNHRDRHIVRTDIADFRSGPIQSGVDVNNLYVNGYYYIVLSRTENLTGSDGSVYMDDVTHLSTLPSDEDKASFIVNKAVKYYTSLPSGETDHYQPDNSAFVISNSNSSLLPYIRVELEEVE